MPPRYPPNPYRVTLDLDPATSDALTQAAKAQNSTRHRLAYEFVQRGLGMGITVAAGQPAPATEPDAIERAVQRGFDDIARYNLRRN